MPGGATSNVLTPLYTGTQLRQALDDLPHVGNVFDTYTRGLLNTEQVQAFLEKRARSLGTATLTSSSLWLLYEIIRTYEVLINLAFTHTHTLGLLGEQEALTVLGKRVGVSTLSSESKLYLYGLARTHACEPLLQKRSWQESISLHDTTFSAAETQRVLPPHVDVLKTVTVRIGRDEHSRLLLWSCIGDGKINRRHLRAVAEQLGLSAQAARHSHIHPPDIDSRSEYGMWPGMVSPLLSPGRPSRLSAAVMVWPPGDQQVRTIALSLSPVESLILTLRQVEINALLTTYALHAFPSDVKYVPLLG
jgi:hypothetical protein